MRSLSRSVVRCFSILLLAIAAGCGGPDASGGSGGSQTADVTAFVGARIVDGTGAAPIEDGALVVRAGRIAAVGPASDVEVPEGAEEVDLSGRTVVPGIINAHGHVGSARGLESGPEVYTRENILDQLEVNARYGVSTVVSLGGDGPEGIRVR
ncbi:MAG: amidohydrolase family protein, partial [bacterium]